MTPLEDRDIVLRVLRGERDAFGLLVERYTNQVFTLAFRMTGSRRDAEDLTQDVFLRAFDQLGKYDPHRVFFTWLYTVALNCIRNHLKKTSTVPGGHDVGPELVDSHSSSDPTPEARVLQEERAQSVQAALAALPLQYREALALRFFQDLPFKEVAQVLGISESAAKMRVYRGLEMMQVEMEKA